jgi:hypothetical protein
MDFPVTRAVLLRLDGWVRAFSRSLPPPVQVPFLDSFRWEHQDKTPEAAQVAKAVRAASGLNAAMRLADLRYTVEVGVLLRTVADFSAEIIYLGEALYEGRLTPDQQKFVEQHFATLPMDPDELAAREREYYVGRKDLAKAHKRIFEKHGGAQDELLKVGAFLNKGYDAYVHGANMSVMELYNGHTSSFMLQGHASERFVCMAKVSIAGKLQGFLNSLRFMALTWGATDLDQQVRATCIEMDRSGEDRAVPCAGLA